MNDTRMEPGSTPPSPQELSTGPTLSWTEVSLDTGTGLADVYGMKSVGDGRIVARAWGSAGDQVVVTTDGTSWFPIGMPDGVSPDHIGITGGRWVVAGVDQSDSEDRHGVFFSDDEGATWTEVTLDLARDEQLPEHCFEQLSVQAALVSGRRIVVLVDHGRYLDIGALLVARGLVAEEASVRGWVTSGDRVTVELGEPAEWGDPSATGTLEVTIDELGLTSAQQSACRGPDSGRVRVLTGDGAGTEEVAAYPGVVASAVSTASGFSITVFEDRSAHIGSEFLLTSPDGRTWTERAIADPGLLAVARRVDGAVWRAGGFDTYRIQRADVGEEPRTVAAFGGLHAGDVLAAGPAGVVTTAWPAPDHTPGARIIKDGYELRLGRPLGGFTLWDLAEDVAVYEFEAEVAQRNEPPEGVREIIEGDGSVTLVFEDPVTGDDLVSFATDDLVPDFGPTTASSSRFGVFDRPPSWIGWSADGTSWGWQSAAEALGIDTANGHPWIDLAVGDDFVLARVDIFTTSAVSGAGTAYQPLPPPVGKTRWFIAKVE